MMTLMHYAMGLARDYVMYFILLKIVSYFKYTSHAVHMDVDSSDLLEQALQSGWLRAEGYVTTDRTIGSLEHYHP